MIRRTAVHAAMTAGRANTATRGAVLRHRTIRIHYAAAPRSIPIRIPITAVDVELSAAMGRPVPKVYVSLRRLPKLHAMVLLSGLIRIQPTAAAAAINVPKERFAAKERA